MIVELADVVSSRDKNIERINVPKNSSPCARYEKETEPRRSQFCEYVVVKELSGLSVARIKSGVVILPRIWGREPNSDVFQ